MLRMLSDADDAYYACGACHAYTEPCPCRLPSGIVADIVFDFDAINRQFSDKKAGDKGSAWQVPRALL